MTRKGLSGGKTIKKGDRRSVLQTRKKKTFQKENDFKKNII